MRCRHVLGLSAFVVQTFVARLLGDTVELGIVPLTASLKTPPGLGFWIYDDRQVVTETWHAELWLDDSDTIALYLRIWSTLRESAVYGADAHNVINAARRSLNAR